MVLTEWPAGPWSSDAPPNSYIVDLVNCTPHSANKWTDWCVAVGVRLQSIETEHTFVVGETKWHPESIWSGLGSARCEVKVVTVHPMHMEQFAVKQAQFNYTNTICQ